MNISLKPSTSGIQYAGWEPRAVAMQGLGDRVLPDQQIPVEADAALHADVYLPEAPGRHPAVVSFGGYNTDLFTAGVPSGANEIGSPPVFTDRGYAPVIIERRGVGRSTGERTDLFSLRDVQDHERAIAWAAEQPWCNGEVMLFGTSYYAMTQLAVAARRPSALRAFFANEVTTDIFRHIYQFGGVPASYFLGVWAGANFTDAALDRRVSPNKRGAISHLTNGVLHPVLERTVHGHVSRMFSSFLQHTPADDVARQYSHWLFDGKTRAEAGLWETTQQMLAAIDVPFATVQNLGYFNLHQFGAYDLFEHAGTSDDRKWLILAPPAYDLPVYSWQGEALAFFDHVLRGTDNGYAEQPHVRYWVDGADTFESAESFPPAGEARRLYLGADTLSTQPTAPGTVSWAAVPVGVPVLPDTDTQVLTFDLEITDEVTLAGPVTATLAFSCNEIDSYVLARLSRVDTDGGVHPVSLGALRPAARTEDLSRGSAVEIAVDSGIREPLVPGEPVALRFSLTPGPVRLGPGETLRLEIGSRTDLLRKDPGEGYVHFDMPVPPYLSRNTLHLGDQSWIELTAV
ncbi:MAG TPA: CocE/NonD family hydrolase [Blastococcus sp.]|nr:CocE/NonD family hydrolase [Blastococcus sp.]